MKNIGVLLSGSGVFDGSEIHEAVLTLLAIDEAGHNAVCMAPDKNQYHVVNHLTGEPMNESRNVLVESARIARGAVMSLKDVPLHKLDALVITGGFGAAKNLSEWAFQGPEAEVDPEVKRVVLDFYNNSKPILSLCVSPVILAKLFAENNIKAKLSFGNAQSESDYDIAAFNQAIESLGAQAQDTDLNTISIDLENKIITAPCYMLKARISEIKNNISLGVNELIKLI